MHNENSVKSQNQAVPGLTGNLNEVPSVSVLHKANYQSPILTVYGRVKELTQGALSGANGDGQSGMYMLLGG